MLRDCLPVIFGDTLDEVGSQQFLLCVAGDSFSCRIDGKIASFPVEGKHGIEGILEQRAIALLAFLQADFRLLAQGDVR